MGGVGGEGKSAEKRGGWCWGDSEEKRGGGEEGKVERRGRSDLGGEKGGCWREERRVVLGEGGVGGVGADLGHDDVLALLDELVLRLDDGLQELEVLHVAAVRLDAVDEVLHHALVDLAAQLEVVHEDVLHGDRLQDLGEHRYLGIQKTLESKVTYSSFFKPKYQKVLGLIPNRTMNASRLHTDIGDHSTFWMEVEQASPLHYPAPPYFLHSLIAIQGKHTYVHEI